VLTHLSASDEVWRASPEDRDYANDIERGGANTSAPAVVRKTIAFTCRGRFARASERPRGRLGTRHANVLSETLRTRAQTPGAYGIALWLLPQLPTMYPESGETQFFFDFAVNLSGLTRCAQNVRRRFNLPTMGCNYLSTHE
jgi:hypothetical protein